MLPTFDEVQQATSSPLEQLERKRKRILKERAKSKSIIMGLLATNIILFVLTYLFLVMSVFLLISVIAIIVVIIRYYITKNKVNAQYQSEFKKGIVAPFSQKMLELCSLPNETKHYEYYCEYNPTEHVDDEWIYGSRLFDFDIHEIHGEDLFVGKLGLTDFEFSELRLVEKQYKTLTQRDGPPEVEYVDVFVGVLFIADFHKDFDGITILESETHSTKGILGRMLRPIKRAISSDDDAHIKIQVESEAFNKAFYVRTSDEVEARYLLSSSMLERILEFNNQHPEQIKISFVDSFMCIAISTSKNYFQTNMKAKITNKHLEEIYNDLKFFFELIEAFDLNNRIWSKK